MSTGMWYPDPTHRHELRYAEAGHWTDFVADRGAVSDDPLASGAPGPAPRRRRKWPWIVGGVALVMFAMIGVLGIWAALNELDRYSADLTKGHGDFPVADNGVAATSYQADGYHLVIREPQSPGGAYLQAPTAHTVLGVEVETHAVKAPSGAAFGPFCWQDGTHGYGFVIEGASGKRELVQVDGSGTTAQSMLASAQGPPIAAGVNTDLMVTCSISPSLGNGAVTVKGYVDGVQVLSATGRMSLSEIHYTGFAGWTGTKAPGEWSVSKFWRRGADDIPK